MEKNDGRDGWADRLARARLRKFPTTWQASKALHRLDPRNLPDAKMLHRYWSERWETGTIRPNRTYRELIERLLDSPGLFQEPTQAPGTMLVPVSSVRPAHSPGGIHSPTVRDARFAPRGGWGREVRMAADDSADHAAISGAQLSDRTLEQLHDDIVRLARSYYRQPPSDVFHTARHIRDTAITLLEHTRRPSQEADLYVIAGQACGLLSTATFDMGYWDAAVRLADAALTYADTAGHSSLRAWVSGRRAHIEDWLGHHEDAARRLEAAIEVAPPGTPTVRLHSIAAKARALLGDHGGTALALRATDEAREVDSSDELHDGIGGEFGYLTARQEFSTGSTYIALGNGPDAEIHARRALGLYADLPEDQRAYDAENGARIDLAIARLLRGDLAGARDALTPVFLLPPARRVAGLTSRIAQARTLLTDSAFRNHRAARQLLTDIDDFTATTAEHGLGDTDL